MAAQTKAWRSIQRIQQSGKWIWQKLVHQLVHLWQRPHPVESGDYLSWRHRFLSNRLRLCLWIAVACYITIALQNFYEVFLYPQRFEQEITQYYGNPDLPAQVRQLTLITNLVVGICLALCLLLQQTTWGKRYPMALFLCFSWSITVAPQIVGTHLRLPDSGGGAWWLMFLAQATLMPVHWRLHLASQLGTLAYYVGLNPLLGLTTIAGKSIYSTGQFVLLFWFCFICNLAVYLYERLQRNEFESRRELRVFLHAVSHDLRTPVMGTSIVLQNLLKKADSGEVMVSKTVLERLLQGSHRQLSLINSLLEGHTAEVQVLVLHRQPLCLSTLVNGVLADLEPALTKNQITIQNQIPSALPLLEADATQIWRVYTNLITNAIKHNPYGINITLGAEVIQQESVPQRTNIWRPNFWRPNFWRSNFWRSDFWKQGLEHLKTSLPSPLPTWICCSVHDNGIGIPVPQQERLFQLYARGSRARYMPGLGLGLYLCRQIITAHGGEIGLHSRSEQGSTFWFTLPIAVQHSTTLLPEEEDPGSASSNS